MIFFMVENFRFNFYSQSCLKTKKIGDDNNNILIIGKVNNGEDNKNFQGPKLKYVKILVNDPFNNRDIILKVTKKVWVNTIKLKIFVCFYLTFYYLL